MEHASNGHSATPPQRTVHVIGIHSDRGGSGKTTLAANLAYLLARTGAKVAVLDADLQSPGLHTLLGIEPKRILHSVSEFAKGQCQLEEVPIDLSRELGLEAGTLYFLPASTDIQSIASILFEGYDVAHFHQSVLRQAQELELDYLILDTHLGINRETLLSLATSDTVLALLRSDGRTHPGAAGLLRIAHSLGVPNRVLVPNMVEDGADPVELGAQLEKDLATPVAGVLPWCPELAQLAGRQLFAAERPDHPFTAELERVARHCMPVEATAGAGS